MGVISSPQINSEENNIKSVVCKERLCFRHAVATFPILTTGYTAGVPMSQPVTREK